MISGCTVLSGFLQVRFDIRHVPCSQLISVALNYVNISNFRIYKSNGPVDRKLSSGFRLGHAHPSQLSCRDLVNAKYVYKVISEKTKNNSAKNQYPRRYTDFRDHLEYNNCV